MRLRDDRPGPFGRRAAHPQPLRLHDLAVPRGRTELLGHQDYLLLREYAENEKSVGSSVRKPPWWPPKRNELRRSPIRNRASEGRKSGDCYSSCKFGAGALRRYRLAACGSFHQGLRI